MAKTKEQKAAIIAKLEDAFKNAVSAVFVRFTKVSVAEESAMRRELRKSGISYFVVKKTLVRRALSSLGHAEQTLPLEGELAVAFSAAEATDATAPARLVHEFGKKLADKIFIVGGLFEGSLLDETHMKEIATIPPMQTLRGMFAQVLNSPRSRFAVVLNAVAAKKA